MSGKWSIGKLRRSDSADSRAEINAKHFLGHGAPVFHSMNEDLFMVYQPPYPLALECVFYRSVLLI